MIKDQKICNKLTCVCLESEQRNSYLFPQDTTKYFINRPVCFSISISASESDSVFVLGCLSIYLFLYFSLSLSLYISLYIYIYIYIYILWRQNCLKSLNGTLFSHVWRRAGWHLIPYRNKSCSEFFSQADKNWHITWGNNLGPDWPPLAKGSKISHYHTPTRPLNFFPLDNWRIRAYRS